MVLEERQKSLSMMESDCFLLRDDTVVRFHTQPHSERKFHLEGRYEGRYVGQKTKKASASSRVSTTAERSMRRVSQNPLPYPTSQAPPVLPWML